LTRERYFSKNFLFWFPEKSKHFITHCQYETTKESSSQFENSQISTKKGGEIESINNPNLME